MGAGRLGLEKKAPAVLSCQTSQAELENSVFSQMNSLFDQTNSLFQSRTGNHAQGTGIAAQTDARRKALKWPGGFENSLLISLFSGNLASSRKDRRPQ